jgi:glycerol-3-phosphate dehydrogenase
MTRSEIWGSLPLTQWDMIVIGGGITGAGVAREAVRRGLKVLLIEQQDYSWGTSSRSSKMVHGGLRYIAQGDIRLTWHSLTERERLLREAPGLVQRMGYFFAHYQGKFPGRWPFSFLVFLYDILAGIRDYSFFKRDAFLGKMPGYRDAGLKGASRYTDALTDDSRLVLRVLDEARQAGAVVINYVKATDLIIENQQVRGLRLQNMLSGEQVDVRAAVAVNATGAWADRLRRKLVDEARVRPLRGSHIVIAHERLPVSEAAIFMHAEDGRPLFIYPWEGRTVIGTTDLDHKEDLDIEAAISQKELDYVLRGANGEFPGAALTQADVIASFSGVRPVVSSGNALNPSQERRDHVVWDNQGLITVTGGKLTTFRLIALDVLKAAMNYLPSLSARDDKAPVFTPVTTSSTGLSRQTMQRLVGRFGFLTQRFLSEMPAGELVPVDPAVTTFWAELRWALRHEQVEHLDDLLLRRTRLGLLLPQGGDALLARLEGFCTTELGWDAARWAAEVARYRDTWSRYYSLPGAA